MSETSAPQGAASYILFSVAGTTYALPTAVVRHMEMIENITRVPNAPSFVDGVVFSRGQVVPVVNLRARFGFERAAYDLRTRVIVVQAGTRTVGLVADAAREFVNIPDGLVYPPHEAMAAPGDRYIDGVASMGERLILILNLEQLLASGEPLPADPAA